MKNPVPLSGIFLCVKSKHFAILRKNAEIKSAILRKNAEIKSAILGNCVSLR